MEGKKKWIMIGLLFLAIALPVTAYLFVNGYFDLRNRASVDIPTTVTKYGSGKDGSCTVSSDLDINRGSCTGRTVGDAINFISTETASAGSNSINLSTTPTGLAVGDEVLIINLKGTEDDYLNVGKYESQIIANISDKKLTFHSELKNKYDGTTQAIMVQRVPHYVNVTVNADKKFYPSNFDGTKGGVMFFRATGTVTVEGVIHADGTGYRKGTVSLTPYTGGPGGESFSGSGGTGGGGGGSVGVGGGGGGASLGSGGAGADRGGAGGGGGGSEWVSGGGGGGGYGSFGYKGSSGAGATNGGINTSGRGGNALTMTGTGKYAGGSGGGGGSYGSSILTVLFFGSGGGAAGNAGGSACLGGSGGSGGGIVLIYADRVNVSGGITSKGGNGQMGAATTIDNEPCRGGGGGGGAGGSIKIITDDIVMGEKKVVATGGLAGEGGGGHVNAYDGGKGGVGIIRVEYTSSVSGETDPEASLYKVPVEPENTFGTGKDGACTVSSNKNLNTDSCVSGRADADAVSFAFTGSLSAGSTTITLGVTPNGLAVGDEILIINLFSSNQDGTKVGKYETAYIKTITDNTLTLTEAISYSYDGATQKILIQRIPQYTNVTVSSGATWSAKAWDGTKGGVFMIKVSDTITVNGTISVVGLGYIGGTGAVNYGGHSLPGGGAITNLDGGYGGRIYTGDYNGHLGISSGGGGGAIGPASNPLGSGGAGSTNVGATGGGGGGSAWERSSTSHGYGGGGGGGGYGTGGKGGQILNSGNAPDGTAESSGAGAKAVAGAPQYAGAGGGGKIVGNSDLSTLFLGGGGGGGGAGYHSSRGGAELGEAKGGDGGNGGGIIYIVAKNLKGSGSILSTGNNGGGIGPNGVGGSGAGGAGGSIKVIGDVVNFGSMTVNAIGGVGSTAAADGGAGGNGRIRVEYYTSITGATNPTASSEKISGGGGGGGGGGSDDPVDESCTYADLNDDGKVNMTDYSLFVSDYLDYRDNNKYVSRSDFNEDKKVNMTDYSSFVECYLDYI